MKSGLVSVIRSPVIDTEKLLPQESLRLVISSAKGGSLIENKDSFTGATSAYIRVELSGVL